jgi:hypothetical protein
VKDWTSPSPPVDDAGVFVGVMVTTYSMHGLFGVPLSDVVLEDSSSPSPDATSMMAATS